MLTERAADVDERAAATTPVGFWLPMSELALERGVSKQVISKNIKRWAKAGVVVTTKKKGKKLLVNVAEYDHARGELGDLSREQGEATKKGEGGPKYASEQTRKVSYEADLAKIKRDEQLGRLVPVEDLERAAIACGEAVVRQIDAIVNGAEELAEAVAKGGVPRARAALKDIARDLRESIANEFARLPQVAMTREQVVEDEKN